MIKTSIRINNKLDTRKMRDGIVRVGWFEGIRYDDGLPVAQVASWNEQGTDGRHGIPKRPFMRPAVYENHTALQDKLRKAYRKALKENGDTMAVLEEFAIYVKTLVWKAMDNVQPGNAPITINGGWMWVNSKHGNYKLPVYLEGKGFDRPLYDTGYMYNTLDYQLEEIFR